MSTLHFPGAVGITHLRVYDSETSDGLHGGSPHVHLVSSEAYIPTAGTGEVQTLTRGGLRTFPLEPGSIVWFEPGVIHRLVNFSGDLELLVIMQNTGLPEAGDAVFTFPTRIMDSTDRYDSSAQLAEGSMDARIEAARIRRDLAIEGFMNLVKSDNLPHTVEQFLNQAVSLRRPKFERWVKLLQQGPERECRLAQQRIESMKDGQINTLTDARIALSEGNDHQTVVGMCGLLRQYHPMEG